MQFSRSHAGMLAVVSIFTGMIAPVVAGANRTYPFPLTDMQWGAYIILALLVISFYLVSVQRWRVFRIVSVMLLVVIGYLLFMSLTGGVHDTIGNTIPNLSWGWTFLAIGSGLLIYTIFGKDEKTENLSIFVDHILGAVGSFTLFCLTGLIVFVSYVPHSREQDTILEEFFGSGKVTYMSGITLSPAFDGIEDVSFDRKTSTLRFIAASGSSMHILPGNIEQDRSPYRITSIGKSLGIISASGTVFLDGNIQSGSAIFPQNLNNATVSQDASGIILITERGERYFPGKHLNVENLIKADDTDTLAWSEQVGTGYVVMKNNDTIGLPVKSVQYLALSKSGYDTLGLVVNSLGEYEVIKNGVRIEQVLSGYVNKTFVSNGSHTMYVNNVGGVKTIIYDGSALKNQFEEVRELFLEESGNSYAFFARPLGEKRYCLFTRYRGNLCGLDGYMNPELGADGGSILYAGLKDGVWSIYRNTDMVVNDTKYHAINIQNDYAFFDITNPKQYLFIEKTSDGKYLFRKNGKIMPGVWNDVGLDVWFGYDNKIITSAKDTEGWRIIEM